MLISIDLLLSVHVMDNRKCVFGLTLATDPLSHAAGGSANKSADRLSSWRNPSKLLTP